MEKLTHTEFIKFLERGREMNYTERVAHFLNYARKRAAELRRTTYVFVPEHGHFFLQWEDGHGKKVADYIVEPNGKTSDRRLESYLRAFG